MKEETERTEQGQEYENSFWVLLLKTYTPPDRTPEPKRVVTVFTCSCGRRRAETPLCDTASQEVYPENEVPEDVEPELY